MVIDFEHHYIPVELARRMGINTENKSIVEEDGMAKANVHAQLFDLMRKSTTWIEPASTSPCKLYPGMGYDAGELPVAQRFARANCKKIIPGASSDLAHLPPLEGEAGLTELERAVGELGLKGVTISSQVHGLSLDAEEFRPFYDSVTRRANSDLCSSGAGAQGLRLVERLSSSR